MRSLVFDVRFTYNILTMLSSSFTLPICNNQAVDGIPFMGGGTRIDKALRQAQSQFFTASNGGRQNVPRTIILLTDGDSGGNPAAVAKEIRASGISIIAVGIGHGMCIVLLVLRHAYELAVMITQAYQGHTSF